MPGLLGGGYDVNAAVLLPAGFIVVIANRFVLAEALHRELIGWNSDFHQVVLRGFGALVPESQVVRFGAALVTVALDRQSIVGILNDDVTKFGGIRLQGLNCIRTKGVLIVVEVGILDLGKQSLDAGTYSRGRNSGLV